MDNYVLLQKIGSGGQGKVFKAQHKESKKIYALKKVWVEDIDSLNYSLKEAQCSIQFKHPHIISCHEFFIERRYEKVQQLQLQLQQPATTATIEFEQQQQQQQLQQHLAPFIEYVCIVYEFCEKGSLEDTIARFRARNNKCIDEEQILIWFRQMCLGVHHMHKYKCIHRDLKAENVFLTLEGNAKIGDLGFAKNLCEKEFATTVLGSRMYIAPEVLQRKPYNEKVDVWGLGCILCKLCTLADTDYAYAMNVNPSGVLDQIRQRGYSDFLVSLVQKLLSVEPADRPELAQVISMLDNHRVNNDNISNNNKNNSNYPSKEDDVASMMGVAGDEAEVFRVTRALQEERAKLKQALAQMDDLNEELFFAREALREKEQQHQQQVNSNNNNNNSNSNNSNTSTSTGGSFLSRLLPSKKAVNDDLGTSMIDWTQYELSVKDIIVKDALDSRMSRIMRGEYRGQEVIVKVIKLVGHSSPSSSSNVLNSNYSLLESLGCHRESKLKHPNIVSWYGFGYKNDTFYLVYEYCELGSLAEVILNHNYRLSIIQKITMAKQVARAMMYLHAQQPPIAYRNLSAIRVLVKKNFDCCLNGFWGVREIGDDDPHNIDKIKGIQENNPNIDANNNNNNNRSGNGGGSGGNSGSGSGGSTGSNNSVSQQGTLRQQQQQHPTSRTNAALAGDIVHFGRLMWQLYVRKQSSDLPTTKQQMADMLQDLEEFEQRLMAEAGYRPPATRFNNKNNTSSSSSSDVLERLHRGYLALMRSCLAEDIAERPTFRRIVYVLEMLLQSHHQ